MFENDFFSCSFNGKKEFFTKELTLNNLHFSFNEYIFIPKIKKNKNT